MVSSSRRVRSIAVVLMALGMMFMAAQPVGAATTKFGAKVAPGLFPSNAYPGQYCDHEINGTDNSYPCTWIMNQAYGGGLLTAPKNGKINKVKIINGEGGTLRVVLARKNASGQFQVAARSGNINYATDECDPDCVVHKYTISPPLNATTGMYLGIQATNPSTLRCDSGGDKIYLFTPPLNPGGPYTSPNSEASGCWLLVQAVYKP